MAIELRAGAAPDDAAAIAALARASLPEAWTAASFRAALERPRVLRRGRGARRGAVRLRAGRARRGGRRDPEPGGRRRRARRGLGRRAARVTARGSARAGVLRVHLEVRGSNAAALALYSHWALRPRAPRALLPRRRGRARARGRAVNYLRGVRRAPRMPTRVLSTFRAGRAIAPGQFAMLGLDPARTHRDPLLPRPMADLPRVRGEARVPLQGGRARHAHPRGARARRGALGAGPARKRLSRAAARRLARRRRHRHRVALRAGARRGAGRARAARRALARATFSGSRTSRSSAATSRSRATTARSARAAS